MGRSLLGLFVLLAACGGAGGRPAQDGDATNVASPSQEGVAPANAEPGPASAIEQPMPKKHRPYEIVNLCPNAVSLIYGDDPKAANAGKAAMASGGRIEDGPRDNDGNQNIWLIVRGDPLVKVRVSKGTKRVEVGRSCDTLEMH